MPLSSGDRLGPYEIVGLLGAGGMGTVYRAHDPRLGRDVALKVLHDSTVLDDERRARFLQEAKAASGLNHPNIVAIYDIGSDAGVAYLVMEIVEGRPLDQMVSDHGLRVSDVLRIGSQIADALAAAHRAGIVHRDLKPANVIVQPDGRVKVLDFGVAKLIEPVTSLDTRTRMVQTGAGVIVGTAPYMSPEQAEAKPLDPRSDIFSLGAVLYEAATGRRAFPGDSPVAALAAVLQQDPPAPAAVRASIPPDLSRLIMRCLRKDPARRAQSMADLKVALEDLREDLDSGRLPAAVPSAASGGRWRARVVWAAVAVAAGALAMTTAALTGLLPRTPDAPPQPVPLTAYPGVENFPSLSPDGSQVAFSWNGERQDNVDLYVALVSGGPPLRLTSDARPDTRAAWSPDGRHIAFVRRLDTHRIALLLVPPLGGPERRLGEFHTQIFLSENPLASAAWSADSRFVFLSAAERPDTGNAILRIAIDTGAVVTLAAPDGIDDSYYSPAVSPDGRRLATVRAQRDAIEIVELSEEQDRRGATAIAAGGLNPTAVAWSGDGREFLLTITNNAPLYRMPVSGGAATIVAAAGPGAFFPMIRGERAVFVRSFRDVNLVRIALDTLAGGTPVVDRIAQSSFRDVGPSYSADGTRLAFYSNRGGSLQIWTANTDGTQATPLTSMDPRATTGSPRWSPDGQLIAFDSNAGGSTYHVYVVRADGGQPRALTSGATNNFAPSWSPDGEWIYFSSNRSGRDEVWRIRSSGGSAEQVTRTGGAVPLVSADGESLFFRTEGSGGVWRMPRSGGDAVQLTGPIYRNNYALAPGGLYYVTPRPDSRIRFLEFASGQQRDILRVEQPVDLGLAVSPDGRFLIYPQEDYAGQDLMLIENLR